MRLLLLAPPGAGKGTQGERLAAWAGIRHIAAGDLLRAEAQAGGGLGHEIADHQARGDLVPDQIVLDVLTPAVVEAAARGGYILDGFPRTLRQATAAADLAARLGVTLDAAIYQYAPEEVLTRRLLDRASELERSAGRAQARGGYAAEAAFVERALTLTADIGRRTARALAAARARLAAGEPRAARDLLSIADRGPLDKLGLVQLEVVRARIAFALGRGGDAPALLLKAAKSLEPLDPIGARHAYLDAASAVWFAGRFATDTHLRDVAAAARGVAWPDTPGAPDLLLRAFATLILDGYAAGAPWWQRTVAALRHGEFSGRDLGWLVLGTELAVTQWDEDAWDELSQRYLRLAREAGAMDVLPIVLTNRACAHVLAGELAAAASLAEEIDVVSEATGIPVPPYASVATAVFGPPAEAFTLIDASLQAAMDRGEGRAVTFIQFQKAILCNALGRYEDAWIAAAAAYEDPSFYSTEILNELIESAARSGCPERAAGAIEDQREVASAAGTDCAAAWRTRPAWAVLPTADGAIHPDVHRFSYDRMGATVTVVEGASHVVMLSRPAVVADVGREAVRSCANEGA